MKREIMLKLQHWRRNKERKPLLLNGARQVGKTYILMAFGQQNFARVHYLNFEETISIHQIFAEDLSPHKIIQQLEFHLNTAINLHKDLLIFDEIQACPRAITSLKYFCEQLPELAICTAGSLLGVQLNETSYPVGKIDILHLYPMNFHEFLLALDDQRSLKIINEINTKLKLPMIIHEHLWQLLKIYFITGGLPEVVNIYIQNQSNLSQALNLVREKQNMLITAYNADFAKHSGKINSMHINRVWHSIPEQLAKEQNDGTARYKFKGVIPGIARYADLVGPIDWLQAAGLIIKIPVCNSGELPLSAYTKENIFKLYCFDVGILGALSNLPPAAIMEYDYGTYKGYFAENFVAQEFLANNAELYSWSEGTAEVEFLRILDTKVIPIEVKSGWITQAKSIKIFQKKYASPYRVIMSAKNLSIDNVNKVHHYPLYLCGMFPLD